MIKNKVLDRNKRMQIQSNNMITRTSTILNIPWIVVGDNDITKKAPYGDVSK